MNIYFCTLTFDQDQIQMENIWSFSVQSYPLDMRLVSIESIFCPTLFFLFSIYPDDLIVKYEIFPRSKESRTGRRSFGLDCNKILFSNSPNNWP